jgi:putative Mg2+ transporter-C (MgtC) family protein
MEFLWSQSFWSEVGIGVPDWPRLVLIAARLLAAVVLAGFVGLEREMRGEDAGLRTHMLVSLGAALFTVIPLEIAAHLGERIDTAELIKGIAAGIGFLGAGAILKRSEHARIHGLTTAASIWATAAIGLAAGAGWIGAAAVATLFCWIILRVLRAVDRMLEARRPSN